jgi:hypothetical protein
MLTIYRVGLQFGLVLRRSLLNEAHHCLRQVVRDESEPANRPTSRFLSIPCLQVFTEQVEEATGGGTEKQHIRIPESDMLETLIVRVLVGVVENLLGAADYERRVSSDFGTHFTCCGNSLFASIVNLAGEATNNAVSVEHNGP